MKPPPKMSATRRSSRRIATSGKERVVYPNENNSEDEGEKENEDDEEEEEGEGEGESNKGQVDIKPTVRPPRLRLRAVHVPASRRIITQQDRSDARKRKRRTDLHIIGSDFPEERVKVEEVDVKVEKFEQVDVKVERIERVKKEEEEEEGVGLDAKPTVPSLACESHGANDNDDDDESLTSLDEDENEEEDKEKEKEKAMTKQKVKNIGKQEEEYVPESSAMAVARAAGRPLTPSPSPAPAPAPAPPRRNSRRSPTPAALAVPSRAETFNPAPADPTNVDQAVNEDDNDSLFGDGSETEADTGIQPNIASGLHIPSDLPHLHQQNQQHHQHQEQQSPPPPPPLPPHVSLNLEYPEFEEDGEIVLRSENTATGRGGRGNSPRRVVEEEGEQEERVQGPKGARSLQDICRGLMMRLAPRYDDIGDLTYDQHPLFFDTRPIEQLQELERNSPLLKTDTDALWQKFVKTKNPIEYERYVSSQILADTSASASSSRPLSWRRIYRRIVKIELERKAQAVEEMKALYASEQKAREEKMIKKTDVMPTKRQNGTMVGVGSGFRGSGSSGSGVRAGRQTSILGKMREQAAILRRDRVSSVANRRSTSSASTTLSSLSPRPREGAGEGMSSRKLKPPARRQAKTGFSIQSTTRPIPDPLANKPADFFTSKRVVIDVEQEHEQGQWQGKEREDGRKRSHRDEPSPLPSPDIRPSVHSCPPVGGGVTHPKIKIKRRPIPTTAKPTQVQAPSSPPPPPPPPAAPPPPQQSLSDSSDDGDIQFTKQVVHIDEDQRPSPIVARKRRESALFIPKKRRKVG